MQRGCWVSLLLAGGLLWCDGSAAFTSTVAAQRARWGVGGAVCSCRGSLWVDGGGGGVGPSLGPELRRRGRCGPHLGGIACVIEVEGTRTEEEAIGELIGSGELAVQVREARVGEGDAVALLRCRAFDQGKDVFRSQLIKMMSVRVHPPFTGRNTAESIDGGSSKGNYLMGGRSRTAFLVAVAEVTGEAERTCAMNLVLSDLDTLLEDGWVTPVEHGMRKKRLLAEWERKAEVIIGSVDCAMHELVAPDLSLARSVYISSMAVRKGFRNRGVGTMLLRGAHRLAVESRGVKEMFLHVEEENDAAVRLYKAQGFTRADMEAPQTAYMDRALRLMLQVPVNALLYSTRIERD